MRVLVIYDSLYGNTEKIARAIGDGLSGAIGTAASVEIIKAGDAHPDQLAGADLLLAGAPTHGSRPSPAMQDLLNRIPEHALASVKVAAFDTRTDMDKIAGAVRLVGKILDRFGYAASRILSSLEKKGGQAVKPPEGFFVKDTQGPLEDGELERAADWARQIVAQGIPVLKRSTQ
jgi:flavodoxin